MIKRTFNADFEGDTPFGMPIYLVAELPVRKQRQSLVSKRVLKKRERQNFNNLSLKRKIQFRRVGEMGAKVIMR